MSLISSIEYKIENLVYLNIENKDSVCKMMFSPKYLSLRFRLISFLWTGGLVLIITHYTLNVGEEVSKWQLFTIVTLALLALSIMTQMIIPIFLNRFNPFLTYNRLVTLTLAGPVLFSLSAYAFFEEIDLKFDYYLVVYLSWTLLFTVSFYCSFELVVDLAVYLEKISKKKKLLNHFQSLSMRSMNSPLSS